MHDRDFLNLIEDLVKLPAETETVEFKANRFDKDDIGKRISALSNSANLHDQKCGYLVFGIEDKTHDIIGTSFSPKMEKIGTDQLEFWLSNHLDPKIDFRIYEKIYNNKKVVLFMIPPAINQPTKFNNIAYIRVSSATPKLNDYPEKESKIWNNINRKSFEKGIAKENVSVAEILKLLDYAAYFSLTKQELPSVTDKFVEKMAQHGLVKKVFENRYDITNLGAVLFAKNLKDFPTIKRKSVRVAIYKGNSKVDRVKEQEESLGYAIAFENLLGYINDKLPHNEEISKALRKEAKMYPEIAVREFVANALIHQDLSISGVDRALINIALYQLPAPSFKKYDNFTKVIMYAHKDLKNMTLDDKVRACFQHCVLKHVESLRMTNATLRERLGIGEKNYPTASAIIKATITQGYIKESEKAKEYVPIWA